MFNGIFYGLVCSNKKLSSTFTQPHRAPKNEKYTYFQEKYKCFNKYNNECICIKIIVDNCDWVNCSAFASTIAVVTES